MNMNFNDKSVLGYLDFTSEHDLKEFTRIFGYTKDVTIDYLESFEYNEKLEILK